MDGPADLTNDSWFSAEVILTEAPNRIRFDASVDATEWSWENEFQDC
jgi:hypothetical protein